jgi:hypothetical protein
MLPLPAIVWGNKMLPAIMIKKECNCDRLISADTKKGHAICPSFAIAYFL